MFFLLNVGSVYFTLFATYDVFHTKVKTEPSMLKWLSGKKKGLEFLTGILANHQHCSSSFYLYASFVFH